MDTAAKDFLYELLKENSDRLPDDDDAEDVTLSGRELRYMMSLIRYELLDTYRKETALPFIEKGIRRTL